MSEREFYFSAEQGSQQELGLYDLASQIQTKGFDLVPDLDQLELFFQTGYVSLFIKHFKDNFDQLDVELWQKAFHRLLKNEEIHRKLVGEGRVALIEKLFSGKSLEQLRPWQELIARWVIPDSSSINSDVYYSHGLKNFHQELLDLLADQDLTVLFEWKPILKSLSYRPELAEKIFDLLLVHEVPDLSVFRNIIANCSRVSPSVEVLRVFDTKHEINLEIWKPVLAAGAESGYARQVFDMLYSRWKQLDVVELNSKMRRWFNVLKICAHQGLSNDILDLINTIEQELDQTKFSWCHEIKVQCVLAGSASRVFAGLQITELEQLEKGSQEEHLVIKCAQAGSVKAFDLLRDKDLIQVSDRKALITACVRGGFAQEVVSMFQQAKTLRDLNPWVDVLRACAIRGQEEDVVKIIFEERAVEDLAHFLMNIDNQEDWLVLIQNCISYEGNDSSADKVFNFFAQADLEQLTKYQEVLNIESCLQHCAVTGAGALTNNILSLFSDDAIAGQRYQYLHRWSQLITTYSRFGLHQEVFDLIKDLEAKQLLEFHKILGECARYGLGQEIFGLLQAKLTAMDATELKQHQFLLASCASGGAAHEVYKFISELDLTLSDDTNWIVPVAEACGNYEKQALVDFLLMKVSELLHQLGISDLLMTKSLEAYEALIQALSFPELLFFKLVVKKNGYLNPQILGRAERLSRFVVEVDKTGSKLYVMKTYRGEVSIVNEIEIQAAEKWQELTESAIPCAPIYKISPKKGGIARVYSRFCGLALRHIELNRLPEEIREKIIRKVEYIEIILKLRRIDHGHLHAGNLVLELIDKEYFEAHGGRENINDIPWSAGHFSYDIFKHLEEGDIDSWEIIVRLIDFDQASNSV